MRNKPILLPFSLLLLIACSPGTRQQDDAVVWFEGARLIVGDGGAPIEHSAFSVENGTFTWVGTGEDGEPRPGVVRVDLSGKTVIPALIDGHSHPGYVDFMEGSVGKDNFSRALLVDHMERYAYYGVAAAHSMGLDRWDANPELPYELRDEVITNAALFLTAGRGIAATPTAGPTFDYWIGIPYGAMTEAEGRQRVQELHANDVSLIKIWVDDRGGTVPMLRPEVYRAIIDEAKSNGQHVAAHIGRTTALADAKELVRSGIHGFVHSVRDTDIDDELITLLRRHSDVWLMPTLPATPLTVEDLPFLSETLPLTEIERLRDEITTRQGEGGTGPSEFFQLQCRNLRRTHHEAGTQIALGTDGRGAGWDAHTQLANMVRCGLSPAEAIVAATRNTAAILGRDDLGMIASGKSADFIVLDADPLVDITNTRRISRVYLRGVAVDRAALRAKWTSQEP